MADVQPSQIRIGDTERESALTALGEHMSAGRLDIDEYGDRTARVSTAKTRGDLTALFSDLPQPHPRFGAAPQPAAPAPTQQVAQQPQRRTPAMMHRLAAVAVPLAIILTVAVLFTGHWWLIFILPGFFTVFGQRMFGDDRNNGRNRNRQRDYRRRGRDW